MRRVAKFIGLLLLAIVALVVLSTIRNNQILMGRVITGAILLVIAAVIVNLTWDRGIVLRLVGGMMALILGISAFGGSCTGTVGDPVRYAALGDSYSSGEGAKASGHPYDNHLVFGPGASKAKDDPKCHRSVSAYPGLIRRKLGQTTLLFTACSGAKINQVTNDHQYPRTPAQLDSLRLFAADGPVDLVTISVGGNDLGFERILTACSTGVCSPNDPLNLKKTLAADLADLPRELALTYRQIREVVGEDVPLLVIGYPEILPTTKGCPSTLGLDAEERSFLNGSVQFANEAVRSAAVLAGAFYVDLELAFDNHRICSGDPYAHGITVPGLDSIVTERDFLSGAYHPTSSGHLCIAHQLLDQYPEPASLVPPPIGSAQSEQPEVGSSGWCP